LFVAIRPPEAIRDLLIDAMDEGPGLSWVGEDNLHLTLRFIGEVDRRQAEEVATALELIRGERFELEIAGVGRFDRRSGGALWAGVRPRKPIAELAAKVDRACVIAGLEPEHRAFHPHITLARYRRAESEAARTFERRCADLSSGPFEVASFILFESHLSRHGAHYEEIEVLRLS
jgi:2'-5' RNA ligase